MELKVNKKDISKDFCRDIEEIQDKILAIKDKTKIRFESN